MDHWMVTESSKNYTTLNLYYSACNTQYLFSSNVTCRILSGLAQSNDFQELYVINTANS